MDKRRTCHVVMLDQKQFGLTFYQLEKAFGIWLANSQNLKIARMTLVNAEIVRRPISETVRAIANKSKRMKFRS